MLFCGCWRCSSICKRSLGKGACFQQTAGEALSSSRKRGVCVCIYIYIFILFSWQELYTPPPHPTPRRGGGYFYLEHESAKLNCGRQRAQSNRLSHLNASSVFVMNNLCHCAGEAYQESRPASKIGLAFHD